MQKNLVLQKRREKEMNSSDKLVCRSLQNTLQEIQDLMLSVKVPYPVKDMALLTSWFYFHLSNERDCIRKF